MEAVLHISATPGIYDLVVGGISLWTTASLIAIDAAPAVSLLDFGCPHLIKIGGGLRVRRCEESHHHNVLPRRGLKRICCRYFFHSGVEPHILLCALASMSSSKCSRVATRARCHESEAQSHRSPTAFTADALAFFLCKQPSQRASNKSSPVPLKSEFAVGVS